MKNSAAPIALDLTTSMPMHRFGSSSDLKTLFQQQLDRFPRLAVDGAPERLVFSEFGGMIIRPPEEQQDQLTHIVFPDTCLAIPNGANSLRSHSDISFPKARLMAGPSSDSLYISVSADRPTDDNLTERVALILSTNQVFLNSDLWNYFSKFDQELLERAGIEPGMTVEAWAEAINRWPSALPEQYDMIEGVTSLRTLPMYINQRGTVGTLSSYHQMPEFTIYCLTQNTFREGNYFEIGSAHIHPEKEYKGLSEKVAGRVGDRKAQMTLSPADVKVLRTAYDAHNKVFSQHGLEKKGTVETFTSIIGLDSQGRVKDIQHHDLGLIDDMKKMKDLNDRAWDTIASDNPDIGLLAEHYEYFSDPSIASNELNGEVGENIGDRSSYRFL